MSKERKPLVWPWAVVVFIVLPVLYVLSAGPVISLNIRGYFQGLVVNCISVFYLPLEWLADHIDVAGWFFDWYRTFCE